MEEKLLNTVEKGSVNDNKTKKWYSNTLAILCLFSMLIISLTFNVTYFVGIIIVAIEWNNIDCENKMGFLITDVMLFSAIIVLPFIEFLVSRYQEKYLKDKTIPMRFNMYGAIYMILQITNFVMASNIIFGNNVCSHILYNVAMSNFVIFMIFFSMLITLAVISIILLFIGWIIYILVGIVKSTIDYLSLFK